VAGALEAIERLVQRPVRRQASRVRSVAELLGQQEAVSLGDPALAKLQGGLQDGDLKRDECAFLAPHVETIGRYRRIVKPLRDVCSHR
jgi:hypothetical protein